MALAMHVQANSPANLSSRKPTAAVHRQALQPQRAQQDEVGGGARGVAGRHGGALALQQMCSEVCGVKGSSSSVDTSM
ncbi:hypothetical protein TSOC_013721 [Tetrabaena socialis]|uniref:Uncharacterized protein n=1 Tax=Tetrabaena socialis TaxID=47790 RepID=A0A2J7ZJL0_9CHLO|nr:hypothetical protein TSOC_013721 [Tetrabaena socialis]|eukprot:PNH00456.1 hypothetical protein TSOC_013721 [Tetrabaena socialis]